MGWELFKINEDIRTLLDKLEESVDPETGEILDERATEFLQELEQLELAKEDKLADLACYYKKLEGDVDKFREREKQLATRRRALEKRKERLKDYIIKESQGRRITTIEVDVSFRRNSSTEVYDLEALEKFDKDLLRYGKPEPKKSDIKSRLTKGEEIPGCKLIYKTSMTVK